MIVVGNGRKKNIDNARRVVGFVATITMATSQALLSCSSPFLAPRVHRKPVSFSHVNTRSFFKVQAAKLPSGVVMPKDKPKFQAPFAGFTKTAEIWNSRACMMGLIGTFIVELILNKGILEMIGVEIGKGLDIPL